MALSHGTSAYPPCISSLPSPQRPEWESDSQLFCRLDPLFFTLLFMRREPHGQASPMNSWATAASRGETKCTLKKLEWRRQKVASFNFFFFFQKLENSASNGLRHAHSGQVSSEHALTRGRLGNTMISWLRAAGGEFRRTCITKSFCIRWQAFNQIQPRTFQRKPRDT